MAKIRHQFSESLSNRLSMLDLIALSTPLNWWLSTKPSLLSSPVIISNWCLIFACIDIFDSLLTTLISLSICEGSFSSFCSHSVVCPLLKKASLDADNLGHYRPISNLNCISNLLQGIVAQWIDTYPPTCFISLFSLPTASFTQLNLLSLIITTIL